MVFGLAPICWGRLLRKTIVKSPKHQMSRVIEKIFVSYYTVAVSVGQFHLRGTEMFQNFMKWLTSAAEVMDLGFVQPVSCVGTYFPYSAMFLAKSLAPYLICVSIALGIWAFIHIEKTSGWKSWKKIWVFLNRK